MKSRRYAMDLVVSTARGPADIRLAQAPTGVHLRPVSLRGGHRPCGVRKKAAVEKTVLMRVSSVLFGEA
jgi:hypothetical protein